VESAAGLRPGSPDNLPLIGALGPDGLLVATGHHRNGMLLAPVTADAVLALLRGEPVPGPVRAADPSRLSLARR
jgi:glycine oxidase